MNEWVSWMNLSPALDLTCFEYWRRSLPLTSRPYICHLFLFFLPPISVLLLFYRIAVSWLSYSVSAWSLGQHVCHFSSAITHLSSFWGFGNRTKSSCFLEDIRVPFDWKQQISTKYKSRRCPTSLYLKRHPYKVILGGIRAEHSASLLKVFICNFCFSLQRLAFMTRHQFFPACPPFVNTVYSQLSPCGHPAITDTPIIWTAAKFPAKINYRYLTEINSRYYGLPLMRTPTQGPHSVRNKGSWLYSLGKNPYKFGDRKSTACMFTKA